VCSREQKKEQKMRRIFALFWLLSFCSSFFFSSQTQVCFCVVVKNTRIRRRKSVLWSRSYGSITALVSKRRGREEYSSTDDDYYNFHFFFDMSRAAALISTNNTMSQFLDTNTWRRERFFCFVSLPGALELLSRVVRARERSRISLSLSPFWWKVMMLTMIIQRNLLSWTLWCTLHKMSQKRCAFLESVFFPNREREKEKERKSFECFFFFCFVKAMMTNISLFHWNPSFFLFVCFDGSLWWRTCSEPICRGRRSMPKEGGV